MIRGRPWREKAPPFGGEFNAAKPLSADFALQNRRFSLQTSLNLPELPPRAPALAERRFDSLCSGRVLLGEVFVGLGGGELLQRAAIALVWWVWHCTAVNKLHSPETERHTGRSLQHLIFDGLYLTVFALYRGAIRRERPANQPAFRSSTNLNHFYPVAGARRKPSKSRSTGFCAGAAGIRSTVYGYTKICTNQKEDSKSP